MWPYPEVRTLADLVTYNARLYPDKAALKFEGRTTTMQELETLTAQFANGLIEKGVGRGDRVLYFGSNSDDFLIALLGTARACASFVPLNWRLSPKEIVDIVLDAEPKIVLTSDAMSKAWSEVAAVLPYDIPVQMIVSGSPQDNPLRHWLSRQTSVAPTETPGLDDIVWILYTSGTTGRPKGVEIAHGAFMLMRMCEHWEPAYTWSEDDTFFFVAPNYHLLGIGLSLQAFFNGATIVVVREFNPELVLREIEVNKPTILAVAPVMIQMMLASSNAATTDFSSVREVVYAGSPISLGLIKQALEKMPCRFMQFYGSTESGGAVTLLRPEEHDLSDEKRLTSCGKPLPLIQIKIMDQGRREVADGAPGEMWIRAPSIAVGYRNQAEEWSKVFEAGWFKTGDIAFRDEDGFIYIIDRAKDMIVTGGENVYSSEVENVLSLHEAIFKVAVICVPSERWGEEVKACIILNEGFEVSQRDLIEFAKLHLAGYKCPKSIDFMTDLPVGGTGKVLKRVLRSPYWEGTERYV